MIAKKNLTGENIIVLAGKRMVHPSIGKGMCFLKKK